MIPFGAMSMPRRSVWIGAACLVFAFACAGPGKPRKAGEEGAKDGATIAITRLQCERRTDPIGLDNPAPHLSWQLGPARPELRDLRQSAYQVLVASSPEILAGDRGDLWDSGRVASDASIELPYAGKALASRQRAHWKVRVWDEAGQPSAWSAPASWEMGLLSATDWSARWIGRPKKVQAPLPMDAKKLDWVAPAGAPEIKAKWINLRGHLKVEAPARLARAHAVIAARQEFHLHVNGALALSGRGRVYAVDILPFLRAGDNVFAIEVRPGQKGKGSGVAFQSVLEPASGAPQITAIGPTWRAALDQTTGWTEPGFSDGKWGKLERVAAFGSPPFESIPLEPVVRADAEPPSYLHHRACFGGEADKAGKPVRARLYATALGIYELHLNGRRVGDAHFAPGWTDYRQRLEYQSHDVTALVDGGTEPNCVELAATLADGWYAGWIGFNGQRTIYGSYPLRLRAQLELVYADGSTRRVVTDGDWRAGTGPIRKADFLKGESSDARLAIAGWPTPGKTPDGFVPVDVLDSEALPVRPRLVAEAGPPIRVVRELKPTTVKEVGPGTFIFDLGQNLVGWARLKVKGEAGTRVRLRFGEMLEPDGTLYTRNLRAATSTDEYILRGDPGGEIWEPRFTTHGFRYVELTGYPGTPNESTLMARVAHSDIRPTGTLRTSNPLVNQLQSNIEWGQRGNFVGLPTDCPQRDERLGWMGDAQIFARTACFNFDVSNFFQKWLRDVYDAQDEEGGLPDTVPYIDGLGKRPGAPGWTDAGIIVPWVMYRCYGDMRFLAEHFDGMKRHIDLLARENPDHLWKKASGHNYGDWLSIDAPTPKDLLGTAYFAYSTGLLADIAARLGHAEDAARYRALRQSIADAFVRTYVKEDGRIEGDTQTAYLLPLAFDLLPAERRAQAFGHLVAALERNNYHLNTGFLGVRELLPVLTEHGRVDLAYRLLLNEGFPSWGYSIRQGATTIWERWDGYTADKGFQDDSMNSFNHYSLGSVGQWMYANVGGIELDPAAPGWKRIVFRPLPGGDLRFASARLRSPYGDITSDWKLEGGQFIYEVGVPVNTRATVHLPDGSRHEVGSGKHAFSVPFGR